MGSVMSAGLVPSRVPSGMYGTFFGRIFSAEA